MGKISGINLSGYHRKNWYQQAMRNLIRLMISLSIAMMMASCLIYFSRQFEYEIQQQNGIYQRAVQQLKEAETQLDHLRQQHSQKQTSNYLRKEVISQFIQLLISIPLKGGLEISQLSNENRETLKLMGHLPHLEQFEQITTALKQQKQDYKIEQFQTNEKNQLTFSLLVYLDGNQNERVDY